MTTTNSIPVTILTGFLGSGKTTVLNRLLKAPDLADTAVIVNEFGEIGLDHLLIEQAFENTVLLKNGCICCSVRGDIADTLATLFERRDAGSIPPFRRIAIETTGLADPAPVAHTLLADGAAYACRLDGIVTTVDAEHGAAQLARQPEARKQVAMADRILITKGDLADPRQAATAARRLNGGAELRHVVHGAVAAEDVFGLGPKSGPDMRVAAWLAAPDPHHDHHEEVAAATITADRPLRWEDVRRWLNSLLSTRGADILRLKGLVHIAGADSPLLLQAVHHVLYPPDYLTGRGQPRTEIVLITRNLPERGLRDSFDAATRTP